MFRRRSPENSEAGGLSLGHEIGQRVRGDAGRNHSLILTQRQAVSQVDEPTATSFQGQGRRNWTIPYSVSSHWGLESKQVQEIEYQNCRGKYAHTENKSWYLA